jgi:nitroimidazol reductase NimA-like FMN-containing flavoprotein (pyridoxamine 5'-phosphate oxidase superfamily)
VEATFRELTKKEIDEFLGRNHVGRIAFSFRNQIDIRPLHFVYAAGWLFGRTSPSDKLITLRHNRWIAFEVDEVEGPFDWTSVVVRGTFYRLTREGSQYDSRLYDRALRAIRKLSPDVLRERDPAPSRTELFGIAADSMTGRSCATRD